MHIAVARVGIGDLFAKSEALGSIDASQSC